VPEFPGKNKKMPGCGEGAERIITSCDPDVNLMRTENVMYFTEKEEEFADLLVAIGTRGTVAKVLVFLANVPEATSRAIERGTDLRQPEVSIAMRHLLGKDWVTSRECRGERKGRPLKIYCLAKSIDAIMDCIEREKQREEGSFTPPPMR